MRRTVTDETPKREKRQNVVFTPESDGLALVSGTSRSSRSPTTSTNSQRMSVLRHISMVEASRHRLSIRKSAAFPMQQTAPKPFLACCADITRHGRDWNAEFQLAWEMEDNTISQAESRMEALRRVEEEFVAEAVYTVRQIVTLDDDGPRELPKFLQCYRVDNIFFRVLPDSRSGRNYVASLRGVLQSRTRLMTVPLSCMLFYRGMPVLAQALVPMPRQPTRLYGADSTNDKEVEAEIVQMAKALNIPFPDGTLEVYEGLDGRYYLTNSNSTLTPLFFDDTIMKRQEMLRSCSNVTDGHDDTMALLDNSEVLDAVVQACMDSESRTVGDCLRSVCEHLHAFGVNMCLLKQVVQKITRAGRYDKATVSQVRELLFVEMLSRSVKQEFYLEVQGKRVAYDDEVLSATLSKHMGEAFANVDVFQSRFLEVVAKKYGVIDEDDDIIHGLTVVRAKRKAEIVARICALLGVTIEKTTGHLSRMKWHVNVNARVLPSLINPGHVRNLAGKYRTIITQDSHRYAFCLPVRWKVACWEGRYEEALDLVHETAMAHREQCGEEAIVPLYSRRSVCEVCFATMQKECIAEGRSLFPGVMRGFEELTCPMTQGRRHIEYGFWLLRVALVYQPDDLVTYRSCVEEAVEHFYSAIEKLPSYLKSEHGSWLHLQPYKGLLQCKRLLPSCSVNTRELVERSIELGSIGWASDFFMLYLWDLSLQLEAEGRYEDAMRVLLTAITVSKRKPTVSFDLPTLLMDAAHIYRSWDQDKFSEHCMTLMREAAEKAGELFGVRSREFGVVVNNKGAIEIELNRLKEAAESLKKAGYAFTEAGVPHDDPDYKAYLENLVFLEQRLTARPILRRGFLRRYPFLASRSGDFPFSDVRPLEDEVFVGLAHQRARMPDNTADAKRVEQMMKERLWELHRFIQDGDVLKRHPFLPAMNHKIPTASLGLDDDIIFTDLVSKLQCSTDSAESRALEHNIRGYVAKKAEDVALQRAYMDRHEQEFNDTHGEYVNLMLPIPWLYVLEDDRFNALCDQLQKYINSQANEAQILDTQQQIARCVEEIEDETQEWRGELSQWLLPSKLYLVSAKDLVEDMHLHDLLRVRRLADPGSDMTMEQMDDLLRDKLTALWERAYMSRLCLAVDDEELHQEFPFLPEMPHHQRLSMLMVFEDPTVSSLVAQLRVRDADSRMQSEMVAAVNSLAARRRDAKELKKWYYDIESVITGAICLEDLPKVRDDYYVGLWQRRNILKADHDEESPLMLLLTRRMEQRIIQMNSWMRKVSANGYRRRLHLEAKYPFLPRRHQGYTLDALDIEVDEEFVSIVVQRQRLLASQDAKPGEIDRLSRRAGKRVGKIAAHRLRQAELYKKHYPFLPTRLEGVETCTIRLEDNEIFAQKAAYYARLRASGSGDTGVRCRRLAREMENVAIATAREISVRNWRNSIESEDLHERYPFLPEEPARDILLGDVRPVEQPEFRALSNELDVLRRDPLRNAAAIRATEEKLSALVVRLAEEKAAATEAAHEQYPFLPRRVLGVRLGDLPLKEDELFMTAASEDGKGKESHLIARAVQLAVSHNLNDAQLADNDDTVLAEHPYLVYTSRKCFPLRHLPLQDDALFNERLDEYDELMKLSSFEEDAASTLRYLLACRADELALREIEKIERIKQTFVALQPLSLEDLCHLQDRREFQNYGDDVASNVSPIMLEDAKRSLKDVREDRAAKVREVDALRKTYPMLGRDIHPGILEHPAIAKLVGDHEELMDDVEGNAGELHKLEEEIARQAGEYKTQLKSDQNALERSRSPKSMPHVEAAVVSIEEDILDDEYYQQLTAQVSEIEAKQDPADAPLLGRLHAQIEGRKSQLQHDADRQNAQIKKQTARTAERYPFLKDQYHGIPTTALNLEEDDEMQRLEQDRETRDSQQAGSPTQVEKAMRERAQEIALALRVEEKALMATLPFLGRSVKGIPLRELGLLTDPNFAELASRYAEVVSSGDAAERSRLEQELRDQAGRIAREVRTARRRDGVRNEDLHERYPFLPEEPARGILLGDVRPVQRPEFRALSNELDVLRRDPLRNAAAIRATEEKLSALVVRLAEEKAAATEAAHEQYPFLPRRVLGVRLGDLPLEEDNLFSQLARRRERQMKNPRTAKDARATEAEMAQRAEALAREAKLVDTFRGDGNEYVRARNPFLLYEDRKCILLSEIPLSGDHAYQQLFRDRLEALEDVEANAPRIAKLEVSLCARADELALGQCEKDSLLKEYPFLVFHNVPGWINELLQDEEFRKLRDRYDELRRDPQKNAKELRELEDAMNDRCEALAQALRTAEGAEAAEQEKLRIKFPMCPDVPATITADSEFVKLTTRRASLLDDAAAHAKSIAMLDAGTIRRASLLSLSLEESNIESYQESEVISFNVRVKRHVVRRRRTRFPTHVDRDLMDALAGHTTGEGEEDPQRETDDSHAEEDVVTAGEALPAHALASLVVVDDDEARERGVLASQEATERHESVVGAAMECEATYRDTVSREEPITRSVLLLTELEEREAIERDDIEKDCRLCEENMGSEMAADERRLAEEAFILHAKEAMEAAIVDAVNGEAADREELLRTAYGERCALEVAQLQAEEGFDRRHIAQEETTEAQELTLAQSHIQAEVARQAAESQLRQLQTHMDEAEAQGRMNVANNEDVERQRLVAEAVNNTKTIAYVQLLNQFYTDEGQQRHTVEATEVGEIAILANCKIVEREVLLRQFIEHDADAAFDSTKTACDECLHRLTAQEEAVRNVLSAEEDERARIMNEEIRDRDCMEANRKEEGSAIERAWKAMEEDCRLARDMESKGRDRVVAVEEEERRALQRQMHAALALSAAVTALVTAEGAARRSVVDSEGNDRSGFSELCNESVVRAKRIQEEREDMEKRRLHKQRGEDAATLIKSVACGYRVRRRLGNRYCNRKAHEYKNAMANTLRMEFAARNAVLDDEKVERQQLADTENRLLALSRKNLGKTLAELEKEEDDTRHQLIDDSMFQLGQLQRASRKLLAKQQDQTPSLNKLKEFEDREDMMHHSVEEPFAKEKPSAHVNDYINDTDDDDDDDDDAPIESGKYKGYALDPIGTFLLQYERDLRRFRASLEKNRQTVAAEHDLLKKSRDNATQEMVHGGSGALWIPTRPLPLSDLVRGPSAQYRRGRIADARGQRPSSRITDADGRAVTPSDAPPFEGFVKQGRPF
ncbi:hypothetical protein DQ04_00951090 [Trypanosoma grayi]|uniref:hypothetical protein n=1 Tax=Trypanosoma grayi TaxID=71804 RepID=UPI0004F4759D|nr:hypothetical protein DQ04_00951090 [Trypanosoma grayi]KEG13533.1 hypothetical protein DQ04_00951090 [Trypanosoma grayi]